MRSWNDIEEMYTIASKRIGTPYAEFGKNMVDLVVCIQNEKRLTHLEPNTAMWILCQSLPSKLSRSIHVGWDSDKYIIYITGDEENKKEIPPGKILDMIAEYVELL